MLLEGFNEVSVRNMGNMGIVGCKVLKIPRMRNGVLHKGNMGPIKHGLLRGEEELV